MQVQAKAKALRVSPRKLGLVAGLVRGRSLREAMTILEYTPRRAAKLLREVMKSAAANAEHNFRLDPEQLTVSRIEVGPGFRLKRYRAAARGIARPILHRTSNLRVVVEAPKPPAATKPPAKSKKPAKRKS